MSTATLSDPISRRVNLRLGSAGLPLTIANILHQIRFWRVLSSATTMVGAPMTAITYRHPPHGHNEEVRGCQSGFDASTGTVHYTVGIEFPVNGKPGQNWRMCIAYEGTDTYAVWLWGKDGVLDHETDIYNDSLYRAVNSLYDEAIKQHNGGFIPLDGDV